MKKPTYNQIELLYRWMSWRLPTGLARHAALWLEDNADREAVSKEIGRMHDLYHSNKLDINSCFDSEIWNGYRPKEEDYEK